MQTYDRSKTAIESHARCSAHSKRTGNPCKAWAMENGKCRLHGGSTPRGMMSPHFRTGTTSRYMPKHLMARYMEAINDPELLSLQQYMAVADTHIWQLLGQLDTGESGQQWKLLDKAVDDMLQGKAANDSVAISDAINTIVRLVQSGSTEQSVWRELHDAMQSRRKLAETETRRLSAMQQTIPVERVMILLSAISAAIKENVSNPKERGAVALAIQKAMGTGVGAGMPPAISGPITQTESTQGAQDE